MPMLPPVMVELKASIGDLKAKLGEAHAEIEKLGKKGAGMGQQMSALGKGAALGLGGVAVAVGAFSLEMADRWEQAHARMIAAMSAAHDPFENHKAQISTVEKQLEHYGFTNAQVEDAVAHSVVSTQNVTKSLGLMGLAADLAKMKGIGLSDATDVLDKALTGNLRPLKQLGIDLPVAASSSEKVKVAGENLAKAQQKLTDLLKAHPDALNAASKAHKGYEAALAGVTTAQGKLSDLQSTAGSIQDALTQRLSGQARTAAETFAGKVAALRAQAEDLGKNLGLRLIPILEDLAKTVMGVVTWLEKHRTIAIILGIAIGSVLVVAIAAYVISMAAAAVATIAATWPILLIIAAVALVGAAIYELATNWSTIWGAIKDAAGAAWHWLDSNVIQPIVQAFSDAYDSVVSDFVNPLIGAWNSLLGAISGIWNWIRDNVINPMKQAFKDIAGPIGGFVKAGGDLLSGNPGKAASDFINSFATGGTVPGPLGAPRLAIVHGGEQVIPVGGSGGASGTLVINMNAPVYGVSDLAQQIRVALLQSGRSLTAIGLA